MSAPVTEERAQEARPQPDRLHAAHDARAVRDRHPPGFPTGPRLVGHATTATLATDRLEARGLLSRGPHPSDRRATLVTISDSGRALVRTASAALGAFEYGLAGTSPAERAELVEVLARLRAVAGD